MSHGQGKPQNGQGNVREKSGNFVRAHGWTPWLGMAHSDTIHRWVLHSVTKSSMLKSSPSPAAVILYKV